MIPKTAIEYFVSVYNSKELTAKVKKLDERFDTEDGTRIPVIAAVLLELGSWQGNDFARMTADERLAFIKGNDSLYLANFDDLIEMASTLTQFHRNGNPNKKAAIEFLEKTINALDGKAEVSQRNGTPPVNQFSLAKGTDEILRTEYPAMRWIVEGLIPEGLTVLAGKSKAGKSWLLLQMALAVAKGQSFLGFNTVKTKAVYLALEDSERRIQSRMKYQQQGGSANLQILDRWEGGIDSLVRDLPAIPDVQLLIIDTWGRFIGKGKKGKKVDGNDYHEVTENVGRLHSIAKERGIAIIVCTHTKKGIGADDWMDDVMGSVALVGCADILVEQVVDLFFCHTLW